MKAASPVHLEPEVGRSVDAAIARAVDGNNAELAGRVADFCRLKLGMTYAQILERVRRVRPETSAAGWDALLAESE